MADNLQAGPKSSYMEVVQNDEPKCVKMPHLEPRSVMNTEVRGPKCKTQTEGSKVKWVLINEREGGRVCEKGEVN